MESPFKSFLEHHNYPQFDIKAILFDMDGVLYDSMKWHAKAWKQTMDEYNLDSTEDEFYLFEGMVGFNTIRTIIKREQNRDAEDDEVNEMYRRKSELFAEFNDNALIPKAYDFVKKVDSKGLISVVVTGSGQASLLDNLGEKFDGIFTKERLVNAYDVKHGKPHPEPYLMGLQKAGNLKPHQAIVIENAPMGVKAAVAAGIFTIAINTGPLDPKVLSDAGADIVLPSMEALFYNFDEYLAILNK